MARDSLQARRFELKYIVDARRARAIRDYLRVYMTPDEHTPPNLDSAYQVCSLYLDTPSLALYRQTCRGLKNRFKLRLRYYSSDKSDPVFLEVKRRETDVICKERVAVTRAGAHRLLCGDRPDAEHLYFDSDRAKARSALDYFCRLRDEVGAGAAGYVFYMREAWVSSSDERLRITFDRNLKGDSATLQCPLVVPRAGRNVHVEGVILEIKFTESFPRWLSGMVQAFDLQRQSVPKYVHCVETLGLERSHRPAVYRGRVA